MDDKSTFEENVVRELRNAVYVKDSELGIVRRVDNRTGLRRRSSSLPPPIFPKTPKYVSQAAQLPHAQVTVEKMSPNLIEKVFDRLETRRRLVKIIDLPSRSLQQLRDIAEFVQPPAGKGLYQAEASVGDLIDFGKSYVADQGDTKPSELPADLINFDESLNINQRDVEPPALKTTDENGFSWLINGKGTAAVSNENLLQLIDDSWNDVNGAAKNATKPNESMFGKEYNMSAMLTAMLSSLSWMDDAKIDQVVKYFESSMNIDDAKNMSWMDDAKIDQVVKYLEGSSMNIDDAKNNNTNTERSPPEAASNQNRPSEDYLQRRVSF